MRVAAIVAVLLGVVAGGLVGASFYTNSSTELMVARLVELEGEVLRLRRELAASQRASKTRFEQLRDQQAGLSGFYGSLLDDVDDVRATVTLQQQRTEPVLARAEKIMDVLRVDDQGDLVVEKANLCVRNGQGATDMVNGKGNIILGYNEYANRGENERSGSHNLVVGSGHSYASYAGVVAGYENAVMAPFAAVMGSRNVRATTVAAVHTMDQTIISDGVSTSRSTPRASASATHAAGGDKTAKDAAHTRLQPVAAGADAARDAPLARAGSDHAGESAALP